MRVQVRKEHIDNGVIGSSKSCPIALAIKDAFDSKLGINVTNLSVDGDEISFNGFSLNVPRKLITFISRFDVQEDVKPFSFSFTPPSLKV